MTETNEKPNLERIVFTKSEPEAAIDKSTEEEIPQLRREVFSFTCPYRITDGKVVLVDSFGRTMFDAGFSREGAKSEMTADIAVQYFDRYHNQVQEPKNVEYLSRRVSSVNPALLANSVDSPQGPLNVLEVRGTIYSFVTNSAALVGENFFKSIQ